MKWLTSYSKKREAAKGFSNQQSQQTTQTFILEPILTPSGILDGGDDTPDPLTLDWETNNLPDIDTVDTDSNVEIDDVAESEVSETNTDLNADSSLDEVAINSLENEISDEDLEIVDFIEKLDSPEDESDEFLALNATESEIAKVDSPEKTVDYNSELAEISNNEIAAKVSSTETEITNTSDAIIDTADDTELQLITESETDSSENLSLDDSTNGVDEIDTTLASDEVDEITDLTVDDISFSEPNFDYDSGLFTVGETGEIGIDFLFDGGKHQGELAIFSLDGMDEFEPGSQEFIKEAASRALSSSDLGHIVIADATEGAKFSGNLGEVNQNSGVYLGVKTFSMRPGDTFAVMLVPNGKVEQVFNNPDIGGAVRPLFSLVTSNPNDTFHVGQIADITGDGNTFVMEDMRVDTGSDRDYNDIIFQVRGATGKAALMDNLVANGKDWRTSDLGQALIAYAEPYIEPEIVDKLELIDEEIPIDDELILPDEVVENLFNESLPANDNQEVFDEPTNEKFVVDKQDVSDEKVEELRADSEIDEKQIVSSSPAEDVVSNGLEDDRILESVSPASANNENDAVDSLAENDQAIEVADSQITTEPINDQAIEVADSQITTEPIDVEDTVTKDKIEEVVSREENAIASPTITTTQPKTEVAETKPTITVNNSSSTVVEKVSVENVSTSTPTLVVAETKNVDSVGELKADSSIVKTVETGNGETQTNVINSDVVVTENKIASNSPITSTEGTTSAVTVTETQNPVVITPRPAVSAKPPIQFEFPQENQPLVGIIDKGFSANNPDINYSRIILGQDRVDGDANPLVVAGEGDTSGTSTLGIIGATQNNQIGINGINDDAPLWVGRAEVNSDQWAQSLMEFVDGAKTSQQPNAVVNLSFNLTNSDGTPRFELTTAERAALAYAQRNNVLIVASAGDNPGQMSALGKAGLEFDNIITVGAAERVNNSVALSKAFAGADYSGSGAGLDIVADGGSAENPITVTSGEGTAKEFGTSVATAKVTGAASQVWAANPKLNFTQVIDILKRTATDLGKPNWDAQTGAGLLNMAAAVTLAKVTTPEPYTVKPGQETITDNFISQNNRDKQLPGDPAHPAVTPPGIPQTTVDQGANDLSGTRIRISATEDVIDQVSSIDPIDVYRGASRELAGAKFKVLTGQAVVSILSPSGQVLSQQVLSRGTHNLQMPANAPAEVLLKITPHGGDATYVLQGFEAERNEPFDINLEFESPLTASQQQIMQAAARSVASLIGKGLPSAVVDGKIIDDINIKVSTANLDGASGTQARTKIDFMRYGTLLPAQSITQFDAADVAELERSGELFSVAQHEFLHALGFGNLWEAKGLVDYAGTPLAQYNGKQAVEEFSKLGGATNYVPLETEGDGSANLHWNDALFQNEVMTFDLGSQPGENGQVTSPISAVTIASLADLGYQVNLNQATPKWGLFGEQFNPENVTEEWLEEQWKRQAEVDPRLHNEGEINLPTVDPATVAPEIWAHAERGPDGEYYDWENYVVSIPGDGFSMIAQRTMGSGSYANWKWIADRNGVYDAPYWVYLGNTIQIPVHRPNYEQEQEAERQRREQELREQQEREARERQEAEDRLRNEQAEQEQLQQELDRLRQEAEAHQQELEEQERRLREELEQRRRQEEWEREQARLAELRRQAEIARQQGKGGLDWYLAKPLPEFGPVDPFETSLTGETVGNLVPDDYYRFTLSRGGRITAELLKLLADADLVLYDARNEPIAYSMREGITDEQIIADLIPGTYMLRVNSPKGVTTDYDLVVKFQHKLSATQTQPLPPGWRPTSIGGNPKTPLHANPTEANPLRGFLHPLNGSGTVTQGNGGSTSHTGRSQYAYDFGVPIGTPVYAMRSGTVVAVVDKYPDTGGGYENRNNFNYVLIEHDGGYRSAYLHLQQGSNSRIGLKVGDTVNAGELIGYSGNSGWSTGPHLHVEVHKPTAGGYFGQTVPFVIGGDAAGDDNSSSNDSATDNDSSSNSDYDYDEEDDSLPIGQLIANEVVALTRESLKGLNQAIADGIRSQFDGIISPLQNKVDEAEKKVANLKSQLESKTDGIIDSISGSVIGGLNATAKNELRNAINEVTDGDFLGGATSVTQAVLAKLSSIGLGFVAGLIEGWVDDRINEAFAPVEEALKTANQALQSAKEELHKVNEVVQKIIDQAIDAAADQLNEWTPYVANLIQALFYAGEEWVKNLTDPEFWMNPELWKKFAEFITGLLITAIVSFIAGAIAGAVGTLISSLGITIPAGVATAATIFATIMGTVIGAYMSRDELMAIYESTKTAMTNLHEGAKQSTTDQELQLIGKNFASESTDALGKIITLVANVAVGIWAGGAGSKVGSSLALKFQFHSSPQAVLGSGYTAVGEKTVPIKKGDLNTALNSTSPGDWVKVYEAGKMNGNKVEVHYFKNKNTGEVFDVKIKYQKWQQKEFKNLEP